MITIPLTIDKFLNHQELKFQLLDAIENQQEIDHLVSEDHNISRCDWQTGRTNPNRKWLELFRPYLFEHLEKWVKQSHFHGFTINEIWFQQYDNTGSYHGWHVHGSNYTFVYYLDFPDQSPKTEIINPATREKVVLDVGEGNIVGFPSMIIHRAPPNYGTSRKTIISWNMDIILEDSYEYN